MPMVRDAFLYEFEQRTGRRLTTEHLHLRLLPRPRLDLRQVEVFDRTSDAPLFVADRLDIAFQIWPLLEGRVVGEYVVVERPRMMIRHDETGRWTIGARVPEASPATTTTPFINRRPECADYRWAGYDYGRGEGGSGGALATGFVTSHHCGRNTWTHGPHTDIRKDPPKRRQRLVQCRWVLCVAPWRGQYG